MAKPSLARRWIFRILVLALVSFGIWWVRRDFLQKDPVEVTVYEVSRGEVASTVTNSKAGTVRARRRAKLSPEIGGRVAEVFFREGARVEAGAVLFRIDSSRIQAELVVARNALASVIARQTERRVAMDRAERALERKRGLAAEHIVSQDLMDELESNFALSTASYGAAGAEVERSRAGVELIETDLERSLVRAPFGGILAEVDVELGEWVTPSPSMMVAPAAIDLIDPDSIYISAPMDEVDSANIKTGQRTTITVDSHRDQSFAGTVVRVAPYVVDIEQQNRTVEIEVDFDSVDATKSLLPGTSADVEVILVVHSDVIRLPTRAVFEGDGALVVNANKLEFRELEIGLRNWDWIEILSGLKPGDRVVDSLDRTGIEAGVEVRVEADRPSQRSSRVSSSGVSSSGVSSS